MAARAEEVRARLMAVFSVEAEEHLNLVTGCLAALERGLPRDEAAAHVETAFRGVHTLKGAARSVGLREVEALCQALEETLGAAKQGRTAVTREVLGQVQRGIDSVSRLLASAAAETSRPGPREASPAGALPSVGQSIRVGAAQLENLHLRSEELLAVKLSLEERVHEARVLAESLARWRDEAAEPARAAGRGGRSHDAATQARVLQERLLRDRRSLALAVDGLYEEARRLRMLPAASILEPFARMSGELARAQGKEVDWEVHGAELEVDRKVLETIKDPLLHLLRNAVDHGIERPDRRVSLGKPPRGRLAVRVLPLEGRRIEVSVEDDGAGIDVGGVRAAAVRTRVIGSAEASVLPDQAALRLALVSGVSTSPVVTDLSGHGLGMAIAREAVERLGGELLVETGAGAGTTVRLRLPSTVATFRGLLVRAGHQEFLLATSVVERVLRVSAKELAATGVRTLIPWNGQAIPVGSLAAALGRAEDGPPENGAGRPCVVVSTGDDRAALLVDAVLGEREVLVKELRPPLVKVPHVAGAGLLGNGELVLILEPADLMRTLGEAPSQAPGVVTATDEAPPAILVVDDSITTRTMERNLLESAGYRVEVAVDGIEAWTTLNAGRFDLVVSDVDMPRMSGFELTARIRADPRLANLPVVLVTALESREDKERGVAAGANAYVIKSGFDQSKLLEIIRRLI